MKYLKVAWQIVVNLAMTLIILAMFRLARSPFETAVIAGLVLIYVAILGAFVSLGYAQSKKWQLDSRRYITLAKAQGLGTEIEEEALKELEESDSKSGPLLMINGAFSTLFVVIAVLNLLGAL